MQWRDHLRYGLTKSFEARSRRTATTRPFGVIGTIAMAALIQISSRGWAADHTFSVTAERKVIAIGSGLTYNAWTYDGTVPGPTLRVKQGDKVNTRLLNQTSDAHGIEILGAQMAPAHFSGDPTSTVTYSFKAEVPGVFDYHCSAIPVLDHIASGMYGMMIVDPRTGWPNGEAQETTIVQGEYYGTADEHGVVTGDHSKMLAADPDFLVFNGALGRYGSSSPIAIKTGELVRVFFLNAGPNLSSNFHVSGVIFSTVYPDGNPTTASHNVPSLMVAPGQGVVLEFKVNEPGDYRFLDTAGAHSYKGALGVFRAHR